MNKYFKTNSRDFSKAESLCDHIKDLHTWVSGVRANYLDRNLVFISPGLEQASRRTHAIYYRVFQSSYH